MGVGGEEISSYYLKHLINNIWSWRDGGWGGGNQLILFEASDQQYLELEGWGLGGRKSAHII